MSNKVISYSLGRRNGSRHLSMLIWLGFMVALAWALPAQAQQPQAMASSTQAKELAEDPVAEKRLMAIAAELRCLVCQNESLSASNADLAVDLRREIRTLIKANQSDQQILDFLVDRYGDFVRYRPPFKPLTWFLWIGPAILVSIGLFVLWRHTQRTRAQKGAAEVGHKELSEQDIANANRLLGQPDTDPSHRPKP